MGTKQYRLHLPAAIVRAFVGLCCVWALVGLAAIGIAFQLSSATRRGETAIAGVARQASTGIAGVEGQPAAAIKAAAGRVNTSLDMLDRQVATVGPVVKKAGLALDGLTADTAKLGDSIDAVNRACVPGPCGTLPDVAKTLNTVRGTFGAIEIAAHHEDANLTTLDGQENQLFLDFDGTGKRLNTSLDTFNALLANPGWALMANKGAGILTTTDAVETKLAKCTLHPTFGCVAKSYTITGAQVTGYLLR